MPPKKTLNLTKREDSPGEQSPLKDAAHLEDLASEMNKLLLEAEQKRQLQEKNQDRVLIVGCGGREHAMARALRRSNTPHKLYIFGGYQNPMLRFLADECFIIDILDVEQVVAKAQELQITLALIGPEAPLSKGLSDALWAAKIPCAAPSQKMAQIETSKSFCRELLMENDLGHFCPKFRVFTEYNEEEIVAFKEELNDQFVLKADGLKGGKGVKLSYIDLHSDDEALEYCKQLIDSDGRFVMEEMLVGEEFSLQTFCDGHHLIHSPLVQDNKRAYDNDRGPNTGGMGSVLLNYHSFPFLTEADVINAQEANVQTLIALQKKFKEPYRGVLFGGFMKTVTGELRILEYNARFGDPEGINVLEVMESDFLEITKGLVQENIEKISFRPEHCVVHYICPQGYPVNPVKDKEIDLRRLREDDNIILAGVHQDNRGDPVMMTGSRAVAIVCSGERLRQVLFRIEDVINRIKGPISYRSDIGKKFLHQSWFSNPEQMQNSYLEAGVDLAEAEHSMTQIAPLVKSTHNDQVLSRKNGFTGLYLNNPEDQMVTVSTMDGVGTKSKLVLQHLGKEEGMKSLGFDLVHANLNDLITAGMGVKPQFFLDYYGCGRLKAAELVSFVSGVSEACRAAQCVLIGGETAELFYLGMDREMVGTMIGQIDKDNLFDYEKIEVGDLVLGIESRGLHTNGYTLVNKLVREGLLDVSEFQDEICGSHPSYLPYLQKIEQAGFLPKGYCHITGGGLEENPPRILPAGKIIEWEPWALPKVFQRIQELADLSSHEMRKTYNCGVGFLVVVKPEDESGILELFKSSLEEGEVDLKVFRMGKILSRSQDN